MPGPPGKAVESIERAMPKATSSAVIGEPSSQLALSRSWKVHEV